MAFKETFFFADDSDPVVNDVPWPSAPGDTTGASAAGKINEFSSTTGASAAGGSTTMGHL
jgi:hypothetical protein